MALVHLSSPVLVAIDVVAWGLVHSLSGYAVHKLPARALERDGRLFAARKFERDGRFYVEVLRIKRWKDRLPEAGALFRGGISKRHLPPPGSGGLERFAVETRRAELGHYLAMLPAPLFALFNPPAVAAVMLVYGVAVNLPFVAIQRYNRIRISRALRSRAGRDVSAARRRSEGDVNGRSMP